MKKHYYENPRMQSIAFDLERPVMNSSIAGDGSIESLVNEKIDDSWVLND